MEHEKFVEVGRAASIVVLTGEDAEHSSILLTKGRVQGPKLATDESAKTASVASTPKPAETSTMSVPSKMEGVSAEQSRVTAKKRSGREDEEDDDETTVDDLREALEALRNEN